MRVETYGTKNASKAKAENMFGIVDLELCQSNSCDRRVN